MKKLALALAAAAILGFAVPVTAGTASNVPTALTTDGADISAQRVVRKKVIVKRRPGMRKRVIVKQRPAVRKRIIIKRPGARRGVTKKVIIRR